MPQTTPAAPAAQRTRHVDPRSLAELAELLGVPAPVADRSVTGVTHDSRAVQPGDLYAALPGAHVDGARFAADATAAGAVAVLTDPAGVPLAEACGLPLLVVDDPRGQLGRLASRVYGDPSAALVLIGVTGTNGKTTTTYLVEAGLRAAGHTTGLIGTIETRIAGRSAPAVRTTPEATDLQALFGVMREQGVTAAAMEVSSHALALGRADGTSYAAGVFLNLSQDHLDFHADMEDYFAAKARLFDGRCAHEVVNVDDEWGRRLVTDQTVTVSSAGEQSAAWQAHAAHPLATGGSAFTATGPDVTLPVTVALDGDFNVGNALAALAAIDACGIDPVAACPGLAEVTVPGRMEAVDAGQDFRAVVDYAHKPGALAAVLAALRPTVTGRLVCVVGCGGDRDTGKRPTMGEMAARGADVLIVTDDNPRTEDPAAIRAAMLEGARTVADADVREIGDRRSAIAAAISGAARGDVVLVAGKGHESGQEVAGAVHPFDDRAVLRELIDGGSDE